MATVRTPRLGMARLGKGQPIGPMVPVASIVIGSLLLLAGCEKPPEAAPPAPPEVLVIDAPARNVPITDEWIGTTEGSANADIRARVSGYLTKQEYTEGSFVKTGSTLFQLDDRPFRAEFALAEASLAKVKADQYKTELEASRLKPLVAKGAASQQEYDNAAQANLANLALIDSAKANIETAKLNLEYTTIKAPIDGVVGIAQAQIGDLVGPNYAKPLTTISTLNPIKVYFPISEQQYLTIARKVGDATTRASESREANLELFLADGKLYPDKGKFALADRQVDPNTGTIRIAALFPNPGNILRPGQYGRIRTVVQTLDNAVVIPQAAVAEVQGNYQIVVVDEANKAHIRPVKVGPRIGSDWVITEGLKAGERVVVEGIQKARADAAVTPKPYTAQATQPTTTTAR